MSAMQFYIVEDSLQKGSWSGEERPGHKYFKRERQADGTYRYWYHDEHERAEAPTKYKHEHEGYLPPMMRVSDEAALPKLLEIGDELVAAQDPHERDKIGFSSMDIQNWRRVAQRADPKDAASMLRLRMMLGKYKRQIAGTVGLDAYYKLGLQDALTRKAEHGGVTQLVKVTDKGELLFDVVGYIGGAQGAFEKYKAINKEFGIRNEQRPWGSGNWVRFLPYAAWATFDETKYREKLAEINVHLDPFPERPEIAAPPPPPPPKPQGTPGSVDEMWEKLRTNGWYKGLGVKWDREKKAFAFRFPGGKLSTYLSNKKGSLGSITKWQMDTKPWTVWVFDIDTAERAIKEMKAIEPGLEVATEGLEEARKEEDERQAKLRVPIPEVAKEIAPGFALYPYQNEGVRFLLDNDGNAMLGDEMGLGKTPQALAYGVVAKRRMVVVNPKNTRRNWIRETAKFFPGYYKPRIEKGDQVTAGVELKSATLLKIQREYAKEKLARGESFDPLKALSGDDEREIAKRLGLTEANLASINYESVAKFIPYIKAAGFDTMVVDECFGPETLVDTPYGPKRIAEIRIGDEVLSATGVGRVLDTRRRQILDSRIELRYSGKTINCSANHPFFTERGWIPASQLREGDQLVTQQEAVRLLSGIVSTPTQAQSILRAILLSEVADAPTGNSRQGLHAREIPQTKAGQLGKEKSRECVAYDPKEPYALGLSSQKGFTVIATYGLGSGSSSGQWNGANTSRSTAFDGLRVSLDLESCRELGKKVTRVSHQLQARSGRCRSQIGDRSRWALALFTSEAGREEGSQVARIRVDGVTVHQSGSYRGNPEGYYYDLEIEGHPSFTVGGALVHNSHRMKDPKTLVAKALAKLAAVVQHHILMSGTAIKNEREEFFTQFSLVRPGMFTDAKQLTAHNIGDLWDKMRPFYLARQQRFVLKDMPEKTTTITHEEMPEVPTLPRTEKGYLHNVWAMHYAAVLEAHANAPAEELDGWKAEARSRADEAVANEQEELAAMDPDEKKDLFRTSIGEYMKLTHAAAIAKVPYTADFVRNILDGSEDNILLFTQSKVAAKLLAKELGDIAIVHHGDLSEDASEVAKARFDKARRAPGETARVFISTINSVKEGVNLTAANKVVFNDLPWTAADVLQAEKRAHRIGQDKHVDVYWMTAADNELEDAHAGLVKFKYLLHRAQVEGKPLTPEEKKWMDEFKPLSELMRGVDEVAADKKAAEEKAAAKAQEKEAKAAEKATKAAEKKAKKGAKPVAAEAGPKEGEKAPEAPKPEAPPPEPPKPAPPPMVIQVPGAKEIDDTQHKVKEQVPATQHTGKPPVAAEVKLEEKAQAAQAPKGQLSLFKSADDLYVAQDDFDLCMSWAGRLMEDGDFDRAMDLIKGAMHKYLRRYPSGKASPRWYYVYKVTSKHQGAPVQMGEKIKLTHEGQAGHYEVKNVHANGYVTMQHDETGHQLSVKQEHLHEMFSEEHKGAIDTAHARLRQTFEAAKKYGSDAQKQRARDSLRQHEERYQIKTPERMAGQKALQLSVLTHGEPSVENHTAAATAHREAAKLGAPNAELHEQLAEQHEIAAKSWMARKASAEALKDPEPRFHVPAEGDKAKAAPVLVLPKKENRGGRRPAKGAYFATKENAYRALKGASDSNGTFLDNFTNADAAYRAWKAGKGPKPPPMEGGDLDHLNQALSLEKPKRVLGKQPKDPRLTSPAEAWDRMVSGAKRWDAATARHAIQTFQAWFQDHGVPMHLPNEAHDAITTHYQAKADADFAAGTGGEHEAAQIHELTQQAAEADASFDPDEIEGKLDDSFDFGFNAEPEASDAAEPEGPVDTSFDFGANAPDDKLAASEDGPRMLRDSETKRAVDYLPLAWAQKLIAGTPGYGGEGGEGTDPYIAAALKRAMTPQGVLVVKFMQEVRKPSGPALGARGEPTDGKATPEALTAFLAQLPKSYEAVDTMSKSATPQAHVFVILPEAMAWSDDLLSKGGGPYIGPKGGMWADPKHTQHWDPTKHAEPVPSHEIEDKVTELTQLSHDELANIKRQQDEYLAKLHAAGDMVPIAAMRLGRIIDRAIEKKGPRLVAKLPAATSSADKVALATKLGKEAFAQGTGSAPSMDPALMKLLEGLAVGESHPLLAAWMRAWHQANAAKVAEQPVQGPPTTDMKDEPVNMARALAPEEVGKTAVAFERSYSLERLKQIQEQIHEAAAESGSPSAMNWRTAIDRAVRLKSKPMPPKPATPAPVTTPPAGGGAPEIDLGAPSPGGGYQVTHKGHTFNIATVRKNKYEVWTLGKDAPTLHGTARSLDEVKQIIARTTSGPEPGPAAKPEPPKMVVTPPPKRRNKKPTAQIALDFTKTAAASITDNPEAQALEDAIHKTDDPPAPVPEMKAPKAKAKPGAKAEPPDSKLVQTGDHIWGSRKDLADLKRIDSSDQLDGMNFDDAAYIVRKKHLVPAHDLDTLRGMGHTPVAANMALALLATIQAKPSDTDKARRDYVDACHNVVESVLNAKTGAQMEALCEELDHKLGHDVKEIKVFVGEEMAMLRNQAERLAESMNRYSKGPVYETERIWGTMGRSDGYRVVEVIPHPYGALGDRFARFVSRRGADWKAVRNANYYVDAEESKSPGSGWAFLQKKGQDKALDKAAQQEAAAARAARGVVPERYRYQRDVPEEVVRKGGRSLKDPDPKRIKETFNLKEVDYGQRGWMSEKDREYHTARLEEAFTDFSDVLGVSPKTVSFNGRLGVALGARGHGKAAAHYEPGRHVINITKFTGGGSLAHEWGHALDNIMASVHMGNKEGKGGGVYLTESHRAGDTGIPNEIRDAMREVSDAITKHPDPAAAKLKHEAHRKVAREKVNALVSENNGLVREHDALYKKPAAENLLKRREQIQRDIDRYAKELVVLTEKGKLNRTEQHSVTNYEFWIKRKGAELESLESPEGVRSEADELRMAEIKTKLDDLRVSINAARKVRARLDNMDPTVSHYYASAQELGEYWCNTKELFARAFESYVEDKMAKRKMQSTYLVTGTTGASHTGKHTAHGPAEVYPREEERANIYTKMDALMDVLIKGGHLKKALEWLERIG